MDAQGLNLQDDPDRMMEILVYHQSLLRNKRCVLAYLQHRLDKVTSIRWELGSVIGEHLDPKLSAHERQYFKDYDGLLNEYMSELGDLDLCADMRPPKDHMISIRVLQEVGAIYAASGAVLDLSLNSVHRVRRADVEGLIQQGQVHIVDADGV